MKYIISMMALLAAFTQPAFAERGQGGYDMDRGGRHVDRMIKDLHLDSEQEPQVRQILKEQHAKMRQQMDAIREQARPKMEALHEETIQRLSTVLNDEQLKEFDNKMEKRRQKMQKRKDRWRERSEESNDD